MAGSNLLPEVFAGLLGDAVGRFLSLDPNSAGYLAPLAGKVIAIRLTPLDFRLYLCPGVDALAILPGFDGKPDLILSGPPLAFARMALSDSPRRALFAGEVVVEGDMTAARHFQTLFERLDIDWEAALARHTGETLAAHVASVLRASHAFGKDTLEAWSLNLAEYWQEESRELPAQAEAEWFYADVDGLRADFDRLEARVSRLERRLSDAQPLGSAHERSI